MAFLRAAKKDEVPAGTIREFQLDPIQDYLRRNQRLQDALRAGAPLPELVPPYSERIQYI